MPTTSPATTQAAAAAAGIDPAVAWLCALLVVMAVSLTSRINVGILAVALAAVVGVYFAKLKADVLFETTFPSNLFLTLVGVTLLFSAAETNCTLQALTQRLVGACRGVSALMPIVFYVLAAIISALGPGAVAATALVAPLAMSIGSLTRVPPVLMALMVANGANAGSLSPFSAVGVLVQTQFKKASLPVYPWSIFFANFVAHALVAAAAYVIFGGLKLSWRAQSRESGAAGCDAGAGNNERIAFNKSQVFTLIVLAAWIVAVVVFRVNIGLAAFAAAALLILAGAAEDGKTLKAVPWSVLLMVCGVTVLVDLGQKIGGIDRFTQMLAHLATPMTVNGVIAMVTGIISTYSSTSGVVYPAFIPAAPGLVTELGGGNALEIAMSINVGAALVDVSPLSTLGALCIAAAVPFGAKPKEMFRVLLIWGFAMCIVGAIFCQFFIRWFT